MIIEYCFWIVQVHTRIILYLKMQIFTLSEAINIARGSIWAIVLFMSRADIVSFKD